LGEVAGHVGDGEVAVGGRGEIGVAADAGDGKIAVAGQGSGEIVGDRAEIDVAIGGQHQRGGLGRRQMQVAGMRQGGVQGAEIAGIDVDVATAVEREISGGGGDAGDVEIAVFGEGGVDRA
jgi:hypothetical protein